MRKKHGSSRKKKLPECALLVATEDKEHCLVVTTTHPADSFTLLGSSEQVLEAVKSGGGLSSIVVGTPRFGEKGLVGVIIRRILSDVQCNSHEECIKFILVESDRNGSPKVQFFDMWTVPLSGVSFTVSDGWIVDLIAPTGKYTTCVRKMLETNEEHLWFLPARKMFSFFVRPSLDFLVEAAKCAYFELLTLRREDILRALMEEVLEHENVVEDLMLNTEGLYAELEKLHATEEENLERIETLSHELSLQKSCADRAHVLENAVLDARYVAEQYKQKFDALSDEIVLLEDSLTSVCRQQDVEYDLYLEKEEELHEENSCLSETLLDLQLELEQARNVLKAHKRLVHALRDIFSKKWKGPLNDRLIEILSDFPEIVPEEERIVE